MNNHAIPDLGALGQPQQIQVLPSALVLNAPDLPDVMVDANRLVELIAIAMRPLVHSAVREELERMGLVGPDA